MVISLSCADCVSSPRFVFPSDPDQLDNIRQVIQGIGPAPEFMLLPGPDELILLSKLDIRE